MSDQTVIVDPRARTWPRGGRGEPSARTTTQQPSGRDLPELSGAPTQDVDPRSTALPHPAPRKVVEEQRQRRPVPITAPLLHLLPHGRCRPARVASRIRELSAVLRFRRYHFGVPAHRRPSPPPDVQGRGPSTRLAPTRTTPGRWRGIDPGAQKHRAAAASPPAAPERPDIGDAPAPPGPVVARTQRLTRRRSSRARGRRDRPCGPSGVGPGHPGPPTPKAKPQTPQG